jgi:uncharacterized membrane protein YesL
VLFFKLLWGGLKDTFSQFMMYALLSIIWWVCALLIIPGPPATVALMSVTDPRRMGAAPELADAIDVFKASWRRSWGIALFTIPFLVMLSWNISYFAGRDHILATMIPLWLIMWLLLQIITMYSFSVAGTMESGVKNAFRGAMFVLISRPFMSIFLGIFMLLLVLTLGVMVIPLLLIGPALVACILNRFTLTILGEEINDPSAPTPERHDERQRGLNPDPGMLNRFRGASKQKGR